jgi:hypothetical protein
VAVVTAKYTKSRAGAKANIRYIQHRRGKDGQRIHRALFGIDGAMERIDAYRMIDESERGSVFYRIILSPDPAGEDTKRDLSLREVTEKTMNAFEERIHKHIAWVAAVHSDHTPIRHVHVLAVIRGRLSYQDFRSLPQVLIQAATAESKAQRRHLDQVLDAQAKEREREEEAWERER